VSRRRLLASCLLVTGVVVGLGVAPVDAQVAPSLSIEAPTIVEGAAGPTTEVEIVFEQSEPSAVPVSWRWTTFDERDWVDEWRPTNPFEDYLPGSGVVTFAPGETTKTVTLTVLDDQKDEPGEFIVVVAVRNTEPIDFSTLAAGAVRIVDDDPPPVLVPGVGQVSESDGNGALLEVPLTLTAPSGHDITVEWTTVNVAGGPVGQALSPGDYAARSGTLFYSSFAGDTTKAARIPIVDDDLFEGTEHVVVAFRVVAGGATMGGFWGLGFGAIADDDPPPVLTPGVVEVAEGDAVAEVPLILSGPSGRDVVVEWTTVPVSGAPPGQALPPGDYPSTSGTLTYSAALGETEKSALVPIVDDGVSEGDEYVVVAFRAVSGAQMGGFWGLGFIFIADDD
jgi:hypothetical protein